jgi:hypothetical protein
MDMKPTMGNEAGISGGKVKRFILNRGNPVPLWLKARVQAMDFQRDDLERTHWKKVCLSMFAD